MHTHYVYKMSLFRFFCSFLLFCFAFLEFMITSISLQILSTYVSICCKFGASLVISTMSSAVRRCVNLNTSMLMRYLVSHFSFLNWFSGRHKKSLVTLLLVSKLLSSTSFFMFTGLPSYIFTSNLMYLS